MNELNYEFSNNIDPVSGPEVLADKTTHDMYFSLSKEPAHKGCVGKKADVAAVVLAGGAGERFGRKGGKQLMTIFGKPILTWSLQAFDACEQVMEIIIVCPPNRAREYVEEAVEPYEFVTPIRVAEAGIVRQVSAMNGAQAVSDKARFIAIHDGARPLITARSVSHAIAVLKGTAGLDGVVIGHHAIDTIKVVEGNNIVGTPDRSMFWVAQTPQVFTKDIYLTAHAVAMEEGYIGTDDSSLVERIGGKVALVNSERNNIKVTVPEDLGPVTAALGKRLVEDDK